MHISTLFNNKKNESIYQILSIIQLLFLKKMENIFEKYSKLTSLSCDECFKQQGECESNL